MWNFGNDLKVKGGCFPGELLVMSFRWTFRDVPLVMSPHESSSRRSDIKFSGEIANNVQVRHVTEITKDVTILQTENHSIQFVYHIVRHFHGNVRDLYILRKTEKTKVSAERAVIQKKATNNVSEANVYVKVVCSPIGDIPQANCRLCSPGDPSMVYPSLPVDDVPQVNCWWTSELRWCLQVDCWWCTSEPLVMPQVNPRWSPQEKSTYM